MANSLEQLDDESLMERIQQHDHQAFSQLVTRHTDIFYGAAYRMVMNVEEAEDIVQEAFLKLWYKPKIWKVDKGAKFTTWFYRIVMNVSLDRIRKNKKSAQQVESALIEEIPSQQVNQEKTMQKRQDQEVLDEALKSLPEKQLIALNLCFYEGMSNKDAANVMGVNVKALESLLMRAKSNIKNYLHREGVLKEGEVA